MSKPKPIYVDIPDDPEPTISIANANDGTLQRLADRMAKESEKESEIDANKLSQLKSFLQKQSVMPGGCMRPINTTTSVNINTQVSKPEEEGDKDANQMMIPVYHGNVVYSGKDSHRNEHIRITLSEKKTRFERWIDVRMSWPYLRFRVERAKKQLMKQLRRKMLALGIINELTAGAKPDPMDQFGVSDTFVGATIGNINSVTSSIDFTSLFPKWMKSLMKKDE